MLQLSDKAFKAIIMQMFQQATTNTLETNGKTENYCRDMEAIKQNQVKELKTIITKIKILLEVLNIADWRRQRKEKNELTMEQ